MPTLTIDGNSVSVPNGATILEAAGKAGVSIPTLCYVDGLPANTSCMICAVQIGDSDRLVPSCATPAADGMAVHTDSENVRANRKLVLDMLLSHHTGDCDAPCMVACPASLDIPRMLRELACGNDAAASQLAHEALVLPRTLGYVCPAPCEKVCRRREHDAALAIPDLHLTAAEGTGNPSLTCAEATGRRIAVIGAGPAGLAAACLLRRRGHMPVIYDENEAPGGMLRYGVEDDRLPTAALDDDIDALRELGLEWHQGVIVSDRKDLDELRAQADAVILATGARSEPERWGLDVTGRGVKVQRETMETGLPGVFAAGGVIREIKRMAVRAVASGLAAAEQVHRFLDDQPPATQATRVNVSMGKLRDGELDRFLEIADDAERQVSEKGRQVVEDERVAVEARRCLHCDCRARENCALRDVAAEYDADTRTWRDRRPTFEHDLSHPEIIYEPGKCIACGLCIRVAQAQDEPYGQTFLGRGIAVRVGPPFRKTLAEALSVCARRCVEVCPTGALAWRDS